MELGTIILSEVTQIQETNITCSSYMWILLLGFQCVSYNLNNFRSEELGRVEGERIFQRGGGNRIYDDKGKEGKGIGGLNGKGAEKEGCRKAYEERKLTQAFWKS